MRKTINKKILTGILSIFLIGIFCGAVIVYGQTPTNTHIISAGIYPGADQYTVWTDSGFTYAKNVYGSIVYSSSNASYVFNSVLDGGMKAVKVLNGTYGISAPIVVDTGTHFYGESTRGVILSQTATMSDIIITESTTEVEQNIEINNFWIDGNGLGTTTTGINLRCYRGMVHDVWVYEVTGVGIGTSGFSVSNQAIENQFYNNIVEDTGNTGIVIGSYAPDNHVYDNIVARPGLYGILTYGWDTQIYSNHVYASVNCGIEATTTLSHIQNNFVEGAGYMGIHVIDGNHNSLIGNIVDKSASSIGIGISGSNYTMVVGGSSGNLFGTPTQEYGVYIDVNSGYNTVSGVNLFNNTIAALFIDAGTLKQTNQIVNCVGFPNTYQFDETYVPDGLTVVTVNFTNPGYTPRTSQIQLNFIETLGSASYYYITNVTATSFKVNLNVDPGKDVWFAWEIAP